MTTGQTSTIYVGQLAVDMNDSKGHELVWRGLTSKTIDPKAKPDKQQKNRKGGSETVEELSSSALEGKVSNGADYEPATLIFPGDRGI